MRWWHVIAMMFSALMLLSCLLVGAALAAGNITNHDMIAYQQVRGMVSEVYIMDIQRGWSWSVTSLARQEYTLLSYSPRWSPDGKRLALASGFNTTRINATVQIFELYLPTVKLTQLTDPYSTITALEWYPLVQESPQLAFTIIEEIYRNIYRVQVLQDSVALALEGPINQVAPRWSPDGKWLAFLSNQNINGQGFDLYITGESLRRLTTTANIMPNYAWSPDSRSIAFTGGNDIFVLHIETGALTNLTQHESPNLTPLWSPDGTQIAFISNRGILEGLYLMNANGSDLRVLIDHEIFDPAWSPDGSQIMYTAEVNQNEEIFVLDIVSGKTHRLTYSTSQERNPVWRP